MSKKDEAELPSDMMGEQFFDMYGKDNIDSRIRELQEINTDIGTYIDRMESKGNGRAEK